jgi:Fe-S cluster assembly protein SufD
MNVDLRAVRSPAEQALSAAFRSVRGASPGAIADLREAAFARFEATGLPHRRIEEWKYTDLRTLMREAKPLAEPAGKTGRAPALAGVDAIRLAIVNGRYEPGWSDVDIGKAGVALTELFDFACAPAGHRIGDAPGKDDIAVSLNTALMTGGVVLRVGRDVALARPVHLAHLFVGTAAAAMFPRSVVIVEPGARLTLVETFDGPPALDYQVNSMLELVIGDRAQVDHVLIGRDGEAALRLSTVGTTVGTGASYNEFFFTSGGGLIRNQLFARFAGEGSEAVIGGASLLRGRQHVDNTLVIEHAVGGCTSRERFRSVLADASRGIFQGKIIVAPHAQKTDAKMASNALLLSEEAEAVNKPELEIFADDVQCGHGATAGALDAALKFYLMARGIPEKDAESLLIQAFIGASIEQVAHEGVRGWLTRTAVEWLAARQ